MKGNAGRRGNADATRYEGLTERLKGLTHLGHALKANIPVEQRNTVGMLSLLNSPERPMYQGTVDKATIAKRRAKNKAARIARRANR